MEKQTPARKVYAHGKWLRIGIALLSVSFLTALAIGVILLRQSEEREPVAKVYFDRYHSGGLNAQDFMKNLGDVQQRLSRPFMEWRLIGDDTDLSVRHLNASVIPAGCPFVVELLPDQIRLNGETVTLEQARQKLSLFREAGRMAGAEPLIEIMIPPGTEIPWLIEYLKMSTETGVDLYRFVDADSA